jgi:hypothetical protein
MVNYPRPYLRRASRLARETACARWALVGTCSLFLLLPALGCNIFFWVALTSPLPCPCDNGYACNSENRCVPAEGTDEEQPCDVDDECADGLVCRDRYRAGACEGYEYDLVCSVGRNLDQVSGTRCRRECNPLLGAVDQCDPGYVCFPDEEGAAVGGGYCQPGTCATDGQCGANGLCVGRAANPDPNDEYGGGLCYRICDPLTCDATGCASCPADDLDDDDFEEVLGCEPMEVIDRLACIQSGDVPVGGVCGGADLCEPGSFCALGASSTSQGVCFEYCRRAGGNPACNAPLVCTGIINDVVGYCQ